MKIVLVPHTCYNIINTLVFANLQQNSVDCYWFLKNKKLFSRCSGIIL